MKKTTVRKPGNDDGAAELWEAYFARNKPIKLRDRIVEYYFDWAEKTAKLLAVGQHLHDVDNAVGESLLHFAAIIVPCYNGRGRFENWATIALKRRLINMRRGQRKPMASLDAPLGKDELTLMEILPARTETEAPDFSFGEFVATLDDQSVRLLRLRYVRQMSIDEAAGVLGICRTAAFEMQKKAIAHLRKVYEVRD